MPAIEKTLSVFTSCAIFDKQDSNNLKCRGRDCLKAATNTNPSSAPLLQYCFIVATDSCSCCHLKKGSILAPPSDPSPLAHISIGTCASKAWHELIHPCLIINDVSCSVLQCVAVCCSVLQCIVVRSSLFRLVSWRLALLRCRALQCVAACCSVL